MRQYVCSTGVCRAIWLSSITTDHACARSYSPYRCNRATHRQPRNRFRCGSHHYCQMHDSVKKPVGDEKAGEDRSDKSGGSGTNRWMKEQGKYRYLVSRPLCACGGKVSVHRLDLESPLRVWGLDSAIFDLSLLALLAFLGLATEASGRIRFGSSQASRPRGLTPRIIL